MDVRLRWIELLQQQTFHSLELEADISAQEAMQFYDTPRNVREAIECPPPNPLGNYDYPTAGNDDHTYLNTISMS